jgi:hypothetical protein
VAAGGIIGLALVSFRPAGRRPPQRKQQSRFTQR